MILPDDFAATITERTEDSRHEALLAIEPALADPLQDLGLVADALGQLCSAVVVRTVDTIREANP